MLTTRTFSDSPAMPGRRRQVSRTSSSTFTPACEARYSARVTSASSSAFILIWIRPGEPAAWRAHSRSIFSSSAVLSSVGAGSSLR